MVIVEMMDIIKIKGGTYMLDDLEQLNCVYLSSGIHLLGGIPKEKGHSQSE